MTSEVRVLHVEDEPDFADLTATFLERIDDRLSVETTHDADAALERLANDIDCIVADYDLPAQTGVKLLRTVREDYPDLPFILYTGKGSEEVASEAISAGVTDYLQKQSGSEQYDLLANRIQNAVDQVRARTQADKHRRVSTVVRDINQALVEATTRDEIDQRVCEIFADADPYVFAWIGTVDSQTRRIEPTAAAGVDEGYLNEITVTADDSPTGHGPGGTALRENRVVVVQDIRDDETFQPWRDSALERGYRAVAAIPLTHRQTQYGLLGLYADHPTRFDEAERDLLDGLGDTIAHAYHRVAVQQRYQDQYRDLFEEAPVMFAITRAVDGEPVIDDCNRLFAERLGYTREELRGRRLAAIYTDESTAELTSGGGYGRALSGEFAREQRDLVTCDGDIIETLLRATPRRNPDGEVVGTHALFVDITDRMHLQTLEDLRERLDFALEGTNSILFDLDLESRAVTRRGPFKQLYGIPSDQLETAEEFYEQCVHPEDRAELQALEQREAVADRDGTVSFDFRTNPDTGDPRWIQFEAYAVTDQNDTPQRLIGLHTDITERKEREQKLERRNERLDEFASIISHDLRNPLNVASGQIELVDTASDSDTERIERVQSALTRIETLLDDLLTYAQEGRRLGELTQTNLEQSAHAAWQGVATEGATLTVETDQSIQADPTRLQQIFENLFGNSIEHGGNDVTVTVGDCDTGFYVADDGPGIPASVRDDVFAGGQAGPDGGTGLGLAIVAEIVNAHGWSIRVTDSQSGGARFDITDIDT